jgi:predicted AAA+ superfamily ATPase
LLGSSPLGGTRNTSNVRDSGLLHALLGVPSFAALQAHPKLGASWEGFALEEVLRFAGDREAYFWNTQGVAVNAWL